MVARCPTLHLRDCRPPCCQGAFSSRCAKLRNRGPARLSLIPIFWMQGRAQDSVPGPNPCCQEPERGSLKQSASTTLPAGGCHNCFLVRTALRANRSLCRFLLLLQFCVCIRVSGRIRVRACGFEVSSRAREGSKDNASACHPMAKATQVRQVRISGQVSCSSLVLGAIGACTGRCTRTTWWLARCRRRRRHQSTVDGPERESLDSSRGGQRHQP